MLPDNIKKYRRAQKMSQEDLAVQLHVVRQTLAKWENSLSVPDADQLILLADVLKVSVNDLLGTKIENLDNHQDIAAELTKANKQIAEYAENERLCKEARKIRGIMFWLTVIAIAIMGAVKNEIAAIVLSAILLVAVLIILYRNMSLLSVGFNSTGNTRSMKIVIVFDIVLVVVLAIFGILIRTDKIHLADNQEALFASVIVTIVIIFTGVIAPRLPHNRYTGLRLPWTVQNEGAWIIALSYINRSDAFNDGLHFVDESIDWDQYRSVFYV